MIRFTKSFLFISFSVFIIFLSTGFNVSMMKCCNSEKIYLGSSLPNCSDFDSNSCCQQEVVQCCSKDKLICCSEFESSCESVTKNLQFDFETLLNTDQVFFENLYVFYKFYYKDFNINISSALLVDFVPKEKIVKPDLSFIQSFLL